MSVLAPGALFAGHRIESLVGRGGMGVVYRARDLELDRVVALKVIAPELLEDSQAWRRLLREARVAASIEHPNVIPLHYAGEHDGIAFLVMRLVEGGDVSRLVRLEGPLAPERAATIAVQAAAGLDAIHAAGLVHRDVKPANLLLAGEHVYVGDFGLAKHVLSRGGATAPGHWVGTLDYVAPEQIRGGRVDARADVYALGGVLHFMLTGRPPFERDGDEAKLWAHLSDPPPRPSQLRPGLPAELDAVVIRAMSKEPAARQPSAGDLGRAARAGARGSAATESERMVARGKASPEGAGREPGLAEEVPTLTRDAPALLAQPSRPAAAPLRDPRRRRWLASAGVAAVAAAVFAGAELAGSGDGDAGGSAARRAETARSTPTPSPPGPRVGQVIEHVGRRPGSITVAGADVWVASGDQDRLTRIDAATGRERRDHPRVGRGALSIASGAGGVWAALYGASAVVRLSPRTGRETLRIPTPLPPVAVVTGSGDLWVVGRARAARGADMLLHYDRNGRERGRIEMPDGVAAMTLGRGMLWVAQLREPYRLVRVNPQTGDKSDWADLGDQAFDLTYAAGQIWASVPDSDSVVRIDARSGQQVRTDAGHQPHGLAVVGESVFVASQTNDTIVVLDRERVRMSGDPIKVPQNPYAITAGLDHVWVTGVATNVVTRLDYG